MILKDGASSHTAHVTIDLLHNFAPVVALPKIYTKMLSYNVNKLMSSSKQPGGVADKTRDKDNVAKVSTSLRYATGTSVIHSNVIYKMLHDNKDNSTTDKRDTASKWNCTTFMLPFLK
ncbi:uncharacterized protein LOC131996425 [Stomoxys calcitrans]|uniref:uncharacterized protein LOC131996425 n=1 Tax=Stomoxys calcitrans TaxID=35570 RepID=UPI0027E37202|nr:uncharacterized protein LOC131996425 [Stomoxys calcitrans]